MNNVETKIWHEVLYRDKGRCRYCGWDFLSSMEAFLCATVDHVTAKAAGGSFTADNLVLACRGCNSMMTRQKGLRTFEARKEFVEKRRREKAPWYEDVKRNAEPASVER